jgi:uncharacterized membrane protein YgaE (UPF0421/DUF939 family)
VAHDLVGHPQPFFAPIAAAISLSTSDIRRGRRIVQMVGGVTLGIGVSEVAATLVGTGPLQIGGVVVVTMAVALIAGFGIFSEGMMFVNQSLASAILVVALHRAGTGAERAIDALVGGGVAAVIGVGLFPAHPLRVMRSAERELLRSLAGALTRVAELLERGDAAEMGWTLAAAQDIHRQLATLTEARISARANVRIAPRRRRLRALVALEDARISHFDLLANAALSLFRSSVGALEDSEAVPAELCAGMDALAAALSTLARTPQPWPPELLAGVSDGLRATIASLAPQITSRTPVIATLVRSTARDLLRILPSAEP